jgi:hypothetical protein
MAEKKRLTAVIMFIGSQLGIILSSMDMLKIQPVRSRKQIANSKDTDVQIVIRKETGSKDECQFNESRWLFKLSDIY